MADIQSQPGERDEAAMRRDLDRREETEVAETRLASAAPGTIQSQTEVAPEGRRSVGTAPRSRSGRRWRSAAPARPLGSLTYVPAWPSIVQRAIWYVDAVITVLLALRFALDMLGANTASFFGNLISRVTAPLVWPFLRLFNVSPVANVSRFETFTVVAIVIYALVAWGLVTLTGLTLAGRRRVVA